MTSGADANLKIGVVGVADGWSTQRLVDAVAMRTGRRSLIELGKVVLDLEPRRVRQGSIDLLSFDALIVKKLGHRYAPELLDRLEMLHFVADRGVRVFSRPALIMRLIDRLSCTVALRLANIPMPETVITEDVEEAIDAAGRFGSAVLKPLYTSKARGMQVIRPDSDARATILAFHSAGNPVLYVQKLLSLPGRDLGVAFLGGEYLACYARVSSAESWNTTTHSGGKYQRHAPSDAVIEAARRAQSLFELDFTCVDVAETPEGPVVFEVSAFGGFRGLLEACGVDAAARYVDYVIRRVRNG